MPPGIQEVANNFSDNFPKKALVTKMNYNFVIYRMIVLCEIEPE